MLKTPLNIWKLEYLRYLTRFGTICTIKKREKQSWRNITFSKVAGPQLATLLKVTVLHGCFSRFLNCKNCTKSRNISLLHFLMLEEMKIMYVCKLTNVILKFHSLFIYLMLKKVFCPKFVVIFGRLSIILTTKWKLDYFSLSREHHVYRWTDLPNSMVATAHKSLPSKDGVIHISCPGLILGKYCMGTIFKEIYRTKFVKW